MRRTELGSRTEGKIGSDLGEVVFVSFSHAAEATRDFNPKPAEYQNLERASCHIPYTVAYEY